jgi:hypothetical protein
MQEIEDNIVPFGFIDDGSEAIRLIEQEESYKSKDWLIPSEEW